MDNEEIIGTAVGGLVAIKVLETGAKIIKKKNIKKTKLDKIKPIKKFKQIKY